MRGSDSLSYSARSGGNSLQTCRRFFVSPLFPRSARKRMGDPVASAAGGVMGIADGQGIKPPAVPPFAARLKSCPVTRRDGYAGIPGLKSETLRQAQGRLWGTHCLWQVRLGHPPIEQCFHHPPVPKSEGPGAPSAWFGTITGPGPPAMFLSTVVRE